MWGMVISGLAKPFVLNIVAPLCFSVSVALSTLNIQYVKYETRNNTRFKTKRALWPVQSNMLVLAFRGSWP